MYCMGRSLWQWGMYLINASEKLAHSRDSSMGNVAECHVLKFSMRADLRSSQGKAKSHQTLKTLNFNVYCIVSASFTSKLYHWNFLLKWKLRILMHTTSKASTVFFRSDWENESSDKKCERIDLKAREATLHF